MMRTASIQSTDLGDPLAAILRPPVGENEYERQLRIQRESEAKRISDTIDDELKKDEKRWRKRKEDVKVSTLRFKVLLLLSSRKSFLNSRPGMLSTSARMLVKSEHRLSS